MMREVIRTTKAILSERQRPLSEWIVVLLTIQWALKTALRRRSGAALFRVMMGREARTAFAALVEEDSDGVQVELVDETMLRKLVQPIVDVQDEQYRWVQENVAAGRTKS